MQYVPTRLLLGASLPVLAGLWAVGSYALELRDEFGAMQADASAALYETHELHGRLDELSSEQGYVLSRLDSAATRDDLAYLKDEIGYEVDETVARLVAGERTALDLHLQQTLNDWGQGRGFDEGRLLLLEDAVYDVQDQLGADIYDLEWRIERAEDEIEWLEDADTGASADQVRDLQDEVRDLQSDIRQIHDRINTLGVDIADLLMIIDDIERSLMDRGSY